MEKLTYWIRLQIYYLQLGVYYLRVKLWEFHRWAEHSRLGDAKALDRLAPDVAEATRMMLGFDGFKRRKDAIERLEAIFDTRADPKAAARIAYCHLTELDDPVAALEWYTRARDAGACWARYPIARLLWYYDMPVDVLKGLGIDRSVEDHYAAASGHLVAAVRLMELQAQRRPLQRIHVWLRKPAAGLRCARIAMRDQMDPRVRMC